MFDEKSRRMYRLVAWVSGITALAVVVYGIVSAIVTTGGVGAFGSNLVNVEFPFPEFAKPISYFSIASVAFFYCELKLWEEKIARWPAQVRSFLRLFGFVVAFASAYEVMYNFMLWGAFFTVQVLQTANPAFINPNVPSCCFPIPWNLVFATKAFSALFAISGYSVYFLRSLDADRTI